MKQRNNRSLSRSHAPSKWISEIHTTLDEIWHFQNRRLRTQRKHTSSVKVEWEASINKSSAMIAPRDIQTLVLIRVFEVDCSPPGSSVHGILQPRILEWVAISFSRGSSQPRDRTQVSHIKGRRFNLWATREALILFYIYVNITLSHGLINQL